jgi:hypothetical protein
VTGRKGVDARPSMFNWAQTAGLNSSGALACCALAGPQQSISERDNTAPAVTCITRFTFPPCLLTSSRTPAGTHCCCRAGILAHPKSAQRIKRAAIPLHASSSPLRVALTAQANS